MPPTYGTKEMKYHQPDLFMSCSRRTVTVMDGIMMAMSNAIMIMYKIIDTTKPVSF